MFLVVFIIRIHHGALSSECHMDTSVARPGLDDEASLVPCCKIEWDGLRLATFTILPDDDVVAAEVYGDGS